MNSTFKPVAITIKSEYVLIAVDDRILIAKSYTLYIVGINGIKL